jgi:hypothetical protein
MNVFMLRNFFLQLALVCVVLRDSYRKGIMGFAPQEKTTIENEDLLKPFS